MRPDLRIRSFLICEDIRREDNGKEILIGVFSGVISTRTLPIRLPRLGVRIEAVSGTGSIEGTLALKVVDPARKILVVIEGTIDRDERIVAGVPFSFSTTFGPVVFHKAGTYRVQLTFREHAMKAGDFLLQHVPQRPATAEKAD